MLVYILFLKSSLSQAWWELLSPSETGESRVPLQPGLYSKTVSNDDHHDDDGVMFCGYFVPWWKETHTECQDPDCPWLCHSPCM
jgi:hypothetical protein